MTTVASEFHAKCVKARAAKGRLLASTRWRQLGLEWRIKQKAIAVCIALSNGKFSITMDGAEGKADYTEFRGH